MLNLQESSSDLEFVVVVVVVAFVVVSRLSTLKIRRFVKGVW